MTNTISAESQAARRREALAPLLAAHLDLVYAAALRQTRDPHMAEDVAQNVFLIAVKKAGHIPQDRAAAWLLKVTRFVALTALRAQRRRAHHERVAALDTSAQTDSSQAALEGHVDEALAALGQSDRQMILLRYFQNHSVPEVAAAFRIADNTASQRLVRALDKLRHYLLRRHVDVPLTALGAMLALAVRPAPRALAQRILLAAGTGKVSAAAGISLGVFLMTLTTKTALVLAAVVILLLAALTGFYVGRPVAQMQASSASVATAASEPQPMVRWSPMVKTVREGHSEALLKEVLAKLQENRAKLRTLHIVGVQTARGYDPIEKTWFDRGEMARGEAWISLAGQERERVEMDYATINMVNRDTFMTTYAAVWDGSRTLTLTTKDETNENTPRLTISAVQQLEAEGCVTGCDSSTALARIQGEGADSTWIDDYDLAPAAFEYHSLKVARVTLDDGRLAVELEMRPDYPNLPQAKQHFSLFWFDESRGYAMLGRREGRDNLKYTEIEAIAEEFTEPAPGVFYPAKARGAIALGDDSQSTYEWRALRVEANQPIAEERFTLTLPPLKQVVYAPEHYAGKPAATQAGTWVTKPGEGFRLEPAAP
jgi:RNA polymerase sigma factor (sigma-70 family)